MKAANKPDVMSHKYGLYILGAGFSCPAGLPLGNELWAEICRRAEPLDGRAGKHFKRDLEGYIAYRAACDGVSLLPSGVELEDFLAYLDVEHYLGLRGSDTWSSDGNETQVLIKTLIGEILTERTPTEIPKLYLDFARFLQPDDVVITFNYDVLLERALDTAGVQYRMFPSRYNHVSPGSATVDDSRKEVVILKMHGSVDWFDRSRYDQHEAQRRKHGLTPGHSHPVFSHEDELGVQPLTDGPRFEGDHLRNLYRVTNASLLYSRDILFSATPALLNPSFMKLVYASPFQDLWNGLGREGAFKFRMVIVGFSMPAHDEYLRQVMYRIVKNYQENNWEEGFGQYRKAPLAVIDFRSEKENQSELIKRYSFVDWTKAETFWEGWNDGALVALKAM